MPAAHSPHQRPLLRTLLGSVAPSEPVLFMECSRLLLCFLECAGFAATDGKQTDQVVVLIDMVAG